MPLKNVTNLCGAKTRTKTECANAAMANGRCRMHSSDALKGIASPHFKDGRRSKYMYLPPHLSSRVEEFIKDEKLTELRESIAVIDARLTELYEKVATGESTGVR